VLLRQDQLSVTLGESEVSLRVPAGQPGLAALAIGPAFELAPAADGLAGDLQTAASRALGANLATGLTNLWLVAPDGSTVGPASYWEPDRFDQSPRLAGDPAAETEGRHRRLDSADRQTLLLTASLRNGGPPIELLLRVDGQGRGLAVRIHPATRQLSLHEVTAGQPGPPIAGGPRSLQKPPLAGLQSLLREVLRAWLAGMLLLALGVLFTPLARLVLGPADWWSPPGAALLGAILLSLLVLVGSNWVATELHERLPHVQDSVAYLFQAQTFALGRLSVPLPPVPEAFAHEFILMRDGAWFSKYPPGFPVMLALGVLAGAPWLVSPLLAAGTIGLLYALGRLLYGGGVGLLAAVLLASSPFFLFMSGSYMAHPAGLFLTTAALLLAARTASTDSSLAPLLAGIALGWLFASRQLTGLAVAAPTVAWLIVARLQRGRSLGALRFLALGWSWPVIALLAYNRALTGNPLLNPFELWWEFDRLGFGPTVGLHGGHDLAGGLWNTYANFSLLERYLFGWPAYLTLAFAVLPFATGRARSGDWLCAGVAVSLMVAYLFYWADGIMFGPRYYYEASGVLALLTARGAVAAAEAASGSVRTRLRRRAPPGAMPFYLAVLLGLIVGNLVAVLPAQAYHQQGYNFVSGKRQAVVEAAGLPRALVLVPTTQPQAWWEYGSVFSANDPLLQRDVIYARDLGPATNQRTLAAFPDRAPYLLVDGRLLPLGSNGAPLERP
jgi:hypothetical protein